MEHTTIAALILYFIGWLYFYITNFKEMTESKLWTVMPFWFIPAIYRIAVMIRKNFISDWKSVFKD